MNMRIEARSAAVAAFLLFCGTASTLTAQELWPTSFGPASIEAERNLYDLAARSVPREPSHGPFLTLGGEGRLSFFAGGDIVPSQTQLFVFIPTEIRGTSYKDVFQMGKGFRVEAALTWESPVKKESNLIMDWGPFLRAGYDSFEGSSRSDDFGNSFDPRSLRMTTAVVGFQIGGTYSSGFFGRFGVGLGIVHYDAVRATFSLSGGPSSSGELLAETLGVASELDFKFGYRIKGVEISLGLDFQFLAGPDRGRDVSSAVKPDPPMILGLTLGVAYRF
jgi:hypothetical protein